VCPVRIQIPKMLLQLRERAAAEGRLPGWLEKGISRYGRTVSEPSKWSNAKKWASRLSAPISSDGWIGRLPGPGRGWTQSRDLRRPAKESFNEWWRNNRGT